MVEYIYDLYVKIYIIICLLYNVLAKNYHDQNYFNYFLKVRSKEKYKKNDVE